jgi:hypothetical protein
MAVTACHYPTGASKYNPVERQAVQPRNGVAPAGSAAAGREDLLSVGRPGGLDERDPGGGNAPAPRRRMRFSPAAEPEWHVKIAHERFRNVESRQRSSASVTFCLLAVVCRIARTPSDGGHPSRLAVSAGRLSVFPQLGKFVGSFSAPIRISTYRNRRIRRGPSHLPGPGLRQPRFPLGQFAVRAGT